MRINIFSKLFRFVYLFFGKRLLDIATSFVLLIFLLPIFLLVYFFVRWKLGKPVFYKQERPGKDGKPFVLNKFRTMTNETDSEGRFLSDDKRLTPLGKFLRSTSLDELPELWNVLKGDMSLVGPRPLLLRYLDRYTPEQARRHEVLPGITGWAQVNGRNDIEFAERFELDVWYVDHLSFYLDIKILVMTIWKILVREGIGEPGEMEEFKGTKKVDL